MNVEATVGLFAILKSAVSGNKLTPDEKEKISPDVLSDMLKLSDDHDVAHLFVLGLKQNGLISEENKGVEKHIFKAVYRYERLRHEYEKLCDTLESLQIPFLPLKGSVIRKLYPEEWMRTSCDIDILVHEEDAEKAKDYLIDRCGYTYDQKSAHDISLLSPLNVHLELHYDLIEDDTANESSKVLRTVWEDATVKNGYSHQLEMSDEMFYFYHIAHMAKHFEEGGCGIRPFVDLYVLDSVKGVDIEKRDRLLAEGRLLKFAESVRRLSGVWFGEKAHDDVTTRMENYIIRGGVYGINANRVMVYQQKKGGRIKYALSKIFLPYDVIKFHYPILEKHPWLFPFMQVRRWGKLIFCGHLKRTTAELRYNSAVSDEKAEGMKTFLNDIGLDKDAK